MAGDKDTLLAMGFDPARVEWALKATGHRGLQPAMDHIFEHENEPIPNLNAEVALSSATRADVDDNDAEDMEALTSLGAVTAEEVEAKSIKCSECGKIFRNTALANFHAERSGHDQFEESTEEIKPLTEEEKKQKLAELREKMAEKRANKAVEEAKENRANVELRRNAGKDLSKIKEDLKLKEAMQEAAAKKREKIEDARARAAVKAQIEADKKARAEKFAREKALREGQSVPAPSSSAEATTNTTKTEAAAGSVSSKEYKDTRLQIRMSGGGQVYTTTLPSDSPLRAVAEYLSGQSTSVDVDTVALAQHFPRKTFTDVDMDKTLRDLGLTPSAVIIATPATEASLPL